jgi:hypothetical protein
MGATLTNLIPTLYSNLDVVSRELVGFIPAVTLDAQASRAAVNQSVRSFVAPAASAGNITAGVTPPNDGDQTIGDMEIKITKARRVPIRWTGEEERGSGPAAAAIQGAQIQQAIRTLVNEIEADIAALYLDSSRAAGTAGTTPFGTAGDYSAASLTRKILADNGSPLSDMQLVLDTAAGANLRGKQASSSQEFGDSMLRQGVLLDINGMMVRESGQVKTHTKGTAANATTNTAGYAVGATTITLASAGTGTIVAGDVITFAGDTNQYVVMTGDTDVSNGGSIVLEPTGLRQAIPASATAITVTASSVRNMGFSRSAIILAQRLPALPASGDLASDRTSITDPRSGLSFEVALYPQYRQMQWEISCCWGVKVVKPEHVALLLG